MAVTNPTEGLTFTNLEKVKQSTNPSQAETARKNISDNFDQFLLLLTTQLQNQDPTEPLDTNQFTQQLVQFSSVEQQVSTNKNLEKLLAATQTNQLNNAVSYIGKSVEAQGNQGMLQGNQAEFAYDLPPGVSNVKISISNADKRVVFSGDGSKKTGKNVVIWDGVNSFTGKREAEGAYTISISAKDAKGDEVKTTTYSTGRVTSVEMKSGALTLNIGTLGIPIDKVISVREAAPIIPAPTQSSNQTNTTNG